ncbi:MAG: hypothetical protein K8I30_19525, partial [Anaerolineae bacterium]|nr:hypothetical protein [Anaerolineae bacterium]
DLLSGALVELTVSDLKPLYRESALVWMPHGTPLSAAAQSFIDAVREQAGHLGLEILPVSVHEQGG